MAKDDQEEAFEKELSALLSRVLDSQKFAEAKNASLLVLDSAWAVASANLLFSRQYVPSSLATALAIAFPFLLASGLVCLISLIPKLNLNRLLRSGPFREPCLLYFGDIATLEPSDYLRRVRARYLPEKDRSASDYYLDDLAGQIAANSSIAARKFRFFSIAAWLAAIAWMVVSIPGLWWCINALWWPVLAA